MSENTVIERHYHDPSQGQINKALYQYLADHGVKGKIEEIVAKKIEEVVTRVISNTLNTPKFDQMLVAAVCHVVSGEKKCFESNSYGFANHIRDLVRQELQKLVVSQYDISVTPKL